MKHSEIANQVFEVEIKALEALKSNLTESFDKAVELILKSEGKVIVSGMGKSGHIGSKIAATLSSTGTSSFFMHPAEAYHGDLGMIESRDIVILISYSGETNEVLQLLAFLRDNGNEVVTITGNPQSSLSSNSTINLDLGNLIEACPLDLAPTSSTTATLVLGDALAVALMKARNFSEKNFARFHPGGNLGRRLLTRVATEMRTSDLPYIDAQDTPGNLVLKLSEGKLGMVIVGQKTKVNGVITDGDLRRALQVNEDFQSLKINSIMTPEPVFVSPESRIEEVQQLMKRKKITTVLVGSRNNLLGVYQFFDV